MTQKPPPTVAPEREPEITAEDIQHIFEDFFKSKRRKRGMVPSIAQCRDVAILANRINRKNLRREAGNFYRMQEREDIVADTLKQLKGELETYGRAIEIMVERSRTYVEHDAYIEMQDNASSLKDTINMFLIKLGRDGRKSPNRSRGFDDARINLLSKVTQEALEATGWKTVSLSSDNGPVCYVVARLMTILTGDDYTAASIARNKRRQKE